MSPGGEGGALREACALLAAVEQSAAPADVAFAAFQREARRLSAARRHATQERVREWLRRRAALDWWIARAGAEPSPRTRALAALALLEGWRPARIARACDGRRGHPARLSAGERALVAQLAGRSLAHPEQPRAVRLACPEWLAAELETCFAAGLERELLALVPAAPIDLRVNTLGATREQVLSSLAAQGVVARPTPFSPVGVRVEGRPAIAALEGFRRGWFEVQDEAAQLAALLLEAGPGMQVLDLCAGAGGKTLALAAAMGGRGRLVACDVRAGRGRRAVTRRRRAGAHNVEVRTLAGERDAWLARQRGRFDRVLIDAPCSGVGSWRRNPDARARITPGQVDELVRLQRGLLASAARLLRPGGTLLYAVCTWLPRETDAQAAWLAGSLPELEPASLAQAWERVAAGPYPGSAPGVLRLTPAQHGTDGFFLALWRRRAAALPLAGDGSDTLRAR